MKSQVSRFGNLLLLSVCAFSQEISPVQARGAGCPSGSFKVDNLPDQARTSIFLDSLTSVSEGNRSKPVTADCVLEFDVRPRPGNAIADVLLEIHSTLDLPGSARGSVFAVARVNGGGTSLMEEGVGPGTFHQLPKSR
jgi:hypothetical protein